MHSLSFPAYNLMPLVIFRQEAVLGVFFQRIPAHKFVLSVGSAVFDAMFNGAMATQNQEDDIDLPDVEAAAFIALLKFLYSDDVQIGPESVMTTLYTGWSLFTDVFSYVLLLIKKFF